jgi:hypothetical protein
MNPDTGTANGMGIVESVDTIALGGFERLTDARTAGPYKTASANRTGATEKKRQYPLWRRLRYARTQDSQTESLGAMDLRDDADAGRGKVFRYLISFAASGYGSWTHDIAEDDRPGRW